MHILKVDTIQNTYSSTNIWGLDPFSPPKLEIVAVKAMRKGDKNGKHIKLAWIDLNIDILVHALEPYQSLSYPCHSRQ